MKNFRPVSNLTFRCKTKFELGDIT